MAKALHRSIGRWSIRLETRRETAMPAGCCFNTQWVPGTRGSLRRPWPQFATNLSFLMHVALQETCAQDWPKMSSKASPWYLLRSLKSDCEKVLYCIEISKKGTQSCDQKTRWIRWTLRKNLLGHPAGLILSSNCIQNVGHQSSNCRNFHRLVGEQTSARSCTRIQFPSASTHSFSQMVVRRGNIACPSTVCGQGTRTRLAHPSLPRKWVAYATQSFIF